MQTFTEFLKKNPNLLSKYVNVGTAVVDAVVQPLNKFMRHLLVVQDIDPNSQPGNKAYQELSDQLDHMLSGLPDQEEYTGPFADDALLRKCLERAKRKFSDLDEKAFRKMTDLSKWPDRKEDKVEPLQVSLSGGRTIEEAMKSAKPVYTASDQDVFAKLAATASPTSTDALKEALEILAKYADKLEEKPTEAFAVGRQATAVGSARRYPSYTRVVRSFKNGVFRRVADEKKE